MGSHYPVVFRKKVYSKTKDTVWSGDFPIPCPCPFCDGLGEVVKLRGLRPNEKGDLERIKTDEDGSVDVDRLNDWWEGK